MRWIVRLLLAALVLLLLAWVTVHYFIVPRIADFRPRLESMASGALGVPVRVGEIEARSGGMVPSFELRDVRLFDAQGRETLRLPRVLASLSAGSLLRLDFDQLFIDEPTLEVRRSADGRIYVAGLPLIKSAQDTDSPVADWFFAQHEFVIRNASCALG
jgi:uncharacterized protein YhdP